MKGFDFIYMDNTRRSRKRESTHNALKHSEKMQFEKYGIENVTIEEISEGADVSRSTFFTHFDSLDDLLSQIANEEIDDIISAACSDGKIDLDALFTQLTDDTYKYPSFMCQMLMKSIVSDGNSSVSKIISLMSKELESRGFGESFESFSSDDVASIVMGAFFGLIFKKLVNKEEFNDADDLKETINKLIYIVNNK